MSLPENLTHTHSGMGGDWPKIKARDLDWNGYEFPSWSGARLFAFDLWCQSGGLADNMYRDILFPWVSGDMSKSFTAIILAWQATTITWSFSFRDTTGTYDGTKSFVVKPWEICEISCNIYHSTWSLRVGYSGGTLRPMEGSNSDLSTSNKNFSFMNAGTTDMTITFKYATSWSDRPIIGVLAKIY